MLPPDVITELRDPAHNMRYRFVGYRKLSRPEVLYHLGQYLSQPRIRRRKHPERNKVITIMTIHGVTADI